MFYITQEISRFLLPNNNQPQEGLVLGQSLSQTKNSLQLKGRVYTVISRLVVRRRKDCLETRCQLGKRKRKFDVSQHQGPLFSLRTTNRSRVPLPKVEINIVNTSRVSCVVPVSGSILDSG